MDVSFESSRHCHRVGRTGYGMSGCGASRGGGGGGSRRRGRIGGGWVGVREAGGVAM